MNKKNYINQILFITFFIFLLDFFIKNLVRNNIELLKKIVIIPKFFYITYVQNTGAAWSILNNSTILLAIISMICFMLLVFYIKKQDNSNRLIQIAYGMLLGGILGNFVDRVMLGYVVDYLDFYIFGYDYPVFNFADSMIVIGTIILVIYSFKGDKHERSSK